MRRRQFLTFGLSCLTLGCTLSWESLNHSPVTAQGTTPLLVSAAASLTDALREIAPLYRQVRPNVRLRFNFAASGALQQQIEAGAPVDVFIAAAEQQMTSLQQKNLLLPGTRRNLLTNQLLLVAPQSFTAVTNLRSLTDRQIKRIAIGNPRSVPAGQYAQEVLTRLGLWEAVQPKLVLANNVRQVLQFVESENAQVGFVYRTDARTAQQVRVVQRIPANLHREIVYPIAVIKTSRNPTAASSFAQFLSSGQAKQVFQKYGFGIA